MYFKNPQKLNIDSFFWQNSFVTFFQVVAFELSTKFRFQLVMTQEQQNYCDNAPLTGLHKNLTERMVEANSDVY